MLVWHSLLLQSISVRNSIALRCFINPLFRLAYLRVRGVDHTEHPIAQELERVKSYMKKIIQIRQAQESGEIPQGTNRARVYQF